MEILSTTNYDQFIFLEKNREDGVRRSHVDKLKESIQSCNMLSIRPIDCNDRLEIIDGQHRCIAAKELGLPIYYRINPEFGEHDIIKLNINKSWTPRDFLNYYVKSGNQEYIKLNDFIKKNGLDIRVATKLTRKSNKDGPSDFKNGKYEFVDTGEENMFDIINETIDIISGNSNHCHYLRTTRFWNAMVKLVRHVHFNERRWFENLRKMMERFSVRATEKDYLRLLMEIHNYRSTQRIDLLEDYTDF